MTDALNAAFAPKEDAAPWWIQSWCPTILIHVLYPDSRKVGFGWWVFIIATWAAFFLKQDGKPMLDASTWLLVVTASTALIGGGTIADDHHDLNMAKIAAAAGGAGASPA